MRQTAGAGLWRVAYYRLDYIVKVVIIVRLLLFSYYLFITPKL